MAWLDPIIARFYDPILRKAERDWLGKERAALIGQAAGKVLEIGAGTGANFKYYPEKVEVLAIEPARAMLRRAQRKAPSNIQCEGFGVGSAAWEELKSSSSFDTIVCTLVLCTVPNAEQTLADLRQMLAPEGKLLILEHIRSHHPRSARWQQFFTPAWKCVAGNCHLDRPTDQWIQSAGFLPLAERYFAKGVPWYTAIYGRG
ncbi:MAG: class I SAM-dependent methyltransferase [Bacteroidota bacterium]